MKTRFMIGLLFLLPFLAACAHPVLECTLKEVKVSGEEYYQGPCKQAPKGKY